MKKLNSLAFCALLSAIQLNCGSMDMDMAGASSGSMGATQGGVQDMTFARGLVEQGRVPPAEAFIVEGLFSEHDLPLEGAPCTTTLCLRSAIGVAPNREGRPATWLQVGMSSAIDPAKYQRPSIAIVAAVDVSGSMGWNYGEATPGAISRSLLYGIADRLEERDRFAMVTYGSTTTTVLTPVSGTDPAVERAIAGLREGGSTNMEAGLRNAYSVAEAAKEQASDVRILLFTDVQPNVGATSGESFEAMAKTGAAKGIGLTVLGLGLGLGVEVTSAMSHLRGGNAFSILSPKDVTPFLQDNWPWMVSAIAYDLKLSVAPSPKLKLARTYGFPTGPDGGMTSLDVASVFLSNRRGAMLLELSPAQGDSLGKESVTTQLSYNDPSGEAHAETLVASYNGEPLDDRGAYMSQPSLGKTVALALLAAGMKEAAAIYPKDKVRAVSILSETLQRFSSDTAAIRDAELGAEAEFWPKLLDLMKRGAPQGNLYGGY